MIAFDILWNFLSFVVALGILVTVHEYGHFWVARKCGVTVKRFSVGFGKVLLRRRDKHNTEFVVSAIPLGGYVQMLDSRIDDINDAEKSQAFDHKNVYQRIAIIAAGPIANFIFAVIAFYFMFLLGVSSVKPIIGETLTESIAAKAGLIENSQIVAVNGETTRNWQDVNIQLIASIGQENLTIETKQADSQYVKTHRIDTTDWQFEPETESALTTLGIKPYMPTVRNIISLVEPGKPADKAGIQKGDEIIRVNGEDHHNNWQSFSSVIQKHANTPVTIELLRNNELILVTLTPQSVQRGNLTVGYIGAAPTVDEWPDSYKQVTQYGVIDAVGQSVLKTWQLITLSFDMIGKLITGDVSIKNLSGPVSIAQGAGTSASYGLVYFLSFLALISINLGIINLLPLPVLDGGHLLYYVVELITGKPVPEKIQALGFKFGTIALLTLMTVAIFNDIARF